MRIQVYNKAKNENIKELFILLNMNLVICNIRRSSCIMSHWIVALKWTLWWCWSSSCAGFSLQLLIYYINIYHKLFIKWWSLVLVIDDVSILSIYFLLRENRRERKETKKKKTKMIKMKKSHSPKHIVIFHYYYFFMLLTV